MNTTLLLTGLLLLAPAAYATGLAVDAAGDCYGTPCDEINEVCKKVGGAYCLGRSAESDCMGTPCDEINEVCKRLTSQYCLGVETECAASACGEVNDRACQPLFGVDCVAAEPEPAAAQARCGGNDVCDTVNRLCGGCIPRAVAAE